MEDEDCWSVKHYALFFWVLLKRLKGSEAKLEPSKMARLTAETMFVSGSLK